MPKIEQVLQATPSRYCKYLTIVLITVKTKYFKNI